jgi:hypothetical protein
VCVLFHVNNNHGRDNHNWLENQVFLFPICTHYQIQAYTLQGVNAAYVYDRNLLHLIMLIV